jgi:hypothetical protein
MRAQAVPVLDFTLLETAMPSCDLAAVTCQRSCPVSAASVGLQATTPGMFLLSPPEAANNTMPPMMHAATNYWRCFRAA